MRRVAFRVDAGAVIGTGHWMRCLTLARALRNAGASIVFISRDPPTALRDALSAEAIALDLLPAGSPLPAETTDDHRRWLAADPIEDAEQTAACVRARFGATDWLIVDHYAIDARWHRVASCCAAALMAIDDLADRPLSADVVLDQSLQDEARYAQRLRRPARILRGDSHALLGEAFSNARASALARRSAASPLRRVLISFGGVDAADLSTAALRAIDLDPIPRLRIEIIMGASAPHVASVCRRADTSPHHVVVETGVGDMAQRMAQADLAFGACGFTSWERCCLGLPTIAVAVAANQRAAAQGLYARGAVRLVDDRGEPVQALVAAWRALRDNAAERVRMARAAAALCDGEGVARVTQAMREHARDSLHA